MRRAARTCQVACDRGELQYLSPAVAAACVRNASWQRALSCLDAAVQSKVTSQTLWHTSAIAACGRSLQWHLSVWLLVRRLLEVKVQPHQEVSFMRKFKSPAAQGRNLRLSVSSCVLSHTSSLAAMKRLTMDGLGSCCIAALRACEVAQQWEQALSLLSMASGRALRLDAEAFRAGISACDRGEAWEAAMCVLATATVTDVDVFQAATKACARARAWTVALALLGETVASAPVVEAGPAVDRPSPFKRDAMRMKMTVLSACERARQWVAALQLFAEMLASRCCEPKLHTSAYRCAIRAVGSARHWQRSVHLLHEMSVYGLSADRWALSAVLWACQLARQHEYVNYHLHDLAAATHCSQSACKELALLDFVRCHARRGNLISVLRAIERFARERRWLKIAGGQKAQLLESLVHSGDRIVELGSYVGYSAIRLVRRLKKVESSDWHWRSQEAGATSVSKVPQRKRRVIAVEAEPLIAAVARYIIAYAGVDMHVDIRVGRAIDVLAPPSSVGPIDLLLLDHRGGSYQEDLAAAEHLLTRDAQIVADNVLHPGAPAFLGHASARFHIHLQSVREYEQVYLEDWIAVCRPRRLSCSGVDDFIGLHDEGEDAMMQRFFRHLMAKASATMVHPELRRWSAEVGQLCHQSQFANVDWRSLQARMRPALVRVLHELDIMVNECSSPPERKRNS